MAGSPCQVDFYVLADAEGSPEELACKLALMAWEQGFRIAVRTEDEQAAGRLDELMWESPSGRFLPHALGEGAGGAPVRIGAGDEAMDEGRDLVINLASTAVPAPGRFRRLLEIVPADHGLREASRTKFRQYRDQGLEPAHHRIGQSR
jgi:DNA polymerase-3 subunit chi